MDVVFYNNTSETNVINKTLNNEITFSGSLRDTTDISNPSILINATENLIDYNYCYIPEFGRYYFITDLTTIRTGIWSINLNCDVLMSFRNEIMESYAIINHTTSYNVNRYLQSDIFKTLVKDFTDILTFPSGLLETGEYILITAGGNS